MKNLTENTYDDAFSFASSAHDGQTRKFSGEPYINHPKGVSDLLDAFGADETLQVAALLHDVDEDTDRSIDDIEKEFGPRVAELVSELTTDNEKRKKFGKQLYMQNHLSNELSDDALTIKLADILYNLMDRPSQSMIDQYLAIVDYLCDNRETFSDIQWEILGDIVDLAA